MPSKRMLPGTGGATELWKTSKLIHAPLIIKSQHSRTFHLSFWLRWTHSWCAFSLVGSRQIRRAENVPKGIQNNQTPEAAWKLLPPGWGMSAVLEIGFQLSHKSACIPWLPSDIASKWDKPCLTCAGLRRLRVKHVGGKCWLINSKQGNICWVIWCWPRPQHHKHVMLLSRRAQNPGLWGF